MSCSRKGRLLGGKGKEDEAFASSNGLADADGVVILLDEGGGQRLDAAVPLPVVRLEADLARGGRSRATVVRFASATQPALLRGLGAAIHLVALRRVDFNHHPVFH